MVNEHILSNKENDVKSSHFIGANTDFVWQWPNRDMNYIHRKEEMDDAKIREIQWMTYLRYIQAFGSRTSLPCLVMKEKEQMPG